MFKKNILIVIGLMLGILLLSACNSSQLEIQNPQSDKINVMVSILPQVDFVKRIGGDKIDVSEMIPPGFSPATYDPSPEQLKKLQNAQLYFRIGYIPFEKAQMKKLKNINPNMKVVDTSEGIQLLTENEREKGEDSDDPHIWLSPILVKVQAKHIYDALVSFHPKDKEYFTKNYNNFITDLDDLDKTLKKTFSPIKGESILVFHPAFGYLAHEYGFKQKAIEIEGKDPSPERLKALVDKALADNIKVVFVQKQFSTKSAEAIANGIGGVVVQIDPLDENYFPNLENMANTIVTNMPK